jgi:phosphatidylserine decarboxylase
MSVFNCHVNRAPVGGRLSDYAYVRGLKAAAFAEKASTENEQNRITLVCPQGAVTFKQIAGALARRIVFYPRVGDELRRGDRIGLIKFGSRVDLFVPDGADLLVQPGNKVKAGRTAIVRWTRSA